MIGLRPAGYTKKKHHLILRSSWHFHPTAWAEFTLRHVPSSATFASRPTAADKHAVALIGRAPLLDPTELRILADAARFVSGHARLILTCRWREHPGAIYFRYQPRADPSDPFWNPITEDAPPLPHLVRGQ